MSLECAYRIARWFGLLLIFLNVCCQNANEGAEIAVECGRNCESDLLRAEALLSQGAFAEALEEYSCANTPEAAFGAGLTQALLLVQNPSFDALMSHLGLPPLPVNQLAGPGSAMVRYADFWRGSGDAEIAGAQMSLTLSFDRMHSHVSPDLLVELTHEAGGLSHDIRLWSRPKVPVQSGDTVALAYDCETSALIENNLADLDFTLSYWDESADPENPVDLSCRVYETQISPECIEDGGSITFEAMGAGPGDAITMAFSNVLMFCIDWSNPNERVPMRLSGRFEGALSADQVYLDDLHLLIRDPEEALESMPATTTVSALAADAMGLTGDLEVAACYLDKADSSGAEPVFSVPAEFHGRDEIPVTSADAKLLAGALHLLTGFIKVVVSYDTTIHPALLFEEDEDTDGTDLQKLVDEINGNLGALKPQHYFTAAELNFKEALDLLDQGLGRLTGASLVVNNAETAAGIAQLGDIVRAALTSLETGPVGLPHVTPALTIDLKTLFAAPPDPGQVATAPATIVEECDGEDCDEYLEIDEAFLQELLDPYLPGFNWEDPSVYEGLDDIDEFMGGFSDNLARYFILEGLAIPLDDP